MLLKFAQSRLILTHEEKAIAEAYMYLSLGAEATELSLLLLLIL